MQVEAGRADILDDDLSGTPPGASRQELPAVRLERASVGLHANSHGGIGSLNPPKLSSRSFGDQLGDPWERALDRQALPRRVEETTH
jgi:hypothetical protein